MINQTRVLQQELKQQGTVLPNRHSVAASSRDHAINCNNIEQRDQTSVHTKNSSSPFESKIPAEWHARANSPAPRSPFSARSVPPKPHGCLPPLAMQRAVGARPAAINLGPRACDAVQRLWPAVSSDAMWGRGGGGRGAEAAIPPIKRARIHRPGAREHAHTHTAAQRPRSMRPSPSPLRRCACSVPSGPAGRLSPAGRPDRLRRPGRPGGASPRS